MMFKILALYGIPAALIDAIKILYTDTSATVLSPDGVTEAFDICAGILQGDTLSPFLFINILDYVLGMSVDKINGNGLEIHRRKSSRNPAVHLTDTDFLTTFYLTPKIFYPPLNLQQNVLVYTLMNLKLSI